MSEAENHTYAHAHRDHAPPITETTWNVTALFQLPLEAFYYELVVATSREQQLDRAAAGQIGGIRPVRDTGR